jgi:hypothetical protein
LPKQGSAAAPARSAAAEEAVEGLRASLKAGIKAAWSREAVRQGVAAAKVRCPALACATRQLPAMWCR